MNPIQFFSLDKSKEKIDKSRPWSPVIFPAELPPPPPGQSAAFYDQLGQATDDVNEAAYIVRPENLSSPPGFQFVHGQPQPETVEEWRQRMEISHSGAHFAQGLPLQEQNTPSPEEEDDFTPELERTPQGYLLRYSRRRPKTLVTNYIIDVESVAYELEEEGNFKQAKIHLRITIVGESGPIPLVLAYDRIDQAGQEIAKMVGTALVIPQAKQSFCKLIGYELRKQLFSAPKRYIYTRTGWFMSPSGKRFYVQDGANPPLPELCYQTGFRFGRSDNPHTPGQLAQSAWRLLSLAREDELECILIPVLFAHLGLLWSLFKEAGYPPHMLLFIKGMTGSLKTAVASLLFNFSGQPESAIPASFRDTSASMEVRMWDYKDRVLLVDDFCPAASEGSKRVLEQNLEQLIRFYGDGIAKSRTNPKLDEVYEKRPSGLCVITGEDSSGSYSSRLRCLYINVNLGTYDKTLLSEFQKNPALWTGYLENFVSFCERNATSIIARIRDQFPQLREQASKVIKERRLVDAYAALYLTAEIFISYIRRISNLPLNYEAELAKFSQTIRTVCYNSAEDSKEADPVKIFARLVHEGIHQGKLHIASKGEFKVAMEAFVGFSDGPYVYFWPSHLFEFVRKEYGRSGKVFPLSEKQLWEQLRQKNILIPPKDRTEGTGKFEYGTRTSFEGRPRMIRIDISGFEPYL